MIDDRPSVRLGYWDPPPAYDQPQLEPRGDIRTVEHEVIGERSVVQKTGENAERFTLRGDTYGLSLQELRTLRGENVELRHSVHSGDVLVTDVSATSTGSWDDVDGDRKWVYTYTVQLVEAI